MEWEKMFANDATSKRLISKIHSSYNSTSRDKQKDKPRIDIFQRRHTDGQHEKMLNRRNATLEKCEPKLQCAITSHWSGWLLSKRLQIINVGDMEKGEPS